MFFCSANVFASYDSRFQGEFMLGSTVINNHYIDDKVITTVAAHSKSIALRYYFYRQLALEAAYHSFGVYKDKYDPSGSNLSRFDLYSKIGADNFGLLFDFNIDSNRSLLVKGGFSKWKYNVEATYTE